MPVLSPSASCECVCPRLEWGYDPGSFQRFLLSRRGTDCRTLVPSALNEDVARDGGDAFFVLINLSHAAELRFPRHFQPGCDESV